MKEFKKTRYYKYTLAFGSVLLLVLFLYGCNNSPNHIIAPPPDIDNFGVSAYSTPDTFDAIGGTLELDSVKILIKDIKVIDQGNSENNFKTGPYVMYLGLNYFVNTIDTGYIPEGTYDKIKFEIHKPNNNDPLPDPEFRDSLGNYSVIAKGRYNGLPFVYKSKKSAHQFLTLPDSIIVTAIGKTNVTLSVNPYTWFISNGMYLDPNLPANENDIDNNIKDSFKAFKDDDKNGIPD